LHELQVRVEIVALRTWINAAEISVREIFGTCDLPCQKAASERIVRDEADP